MMLVFLAAIPQVFAQTAYPEPHSSCKPVELDVASLDFGGSDLQKAEVTFSSRLVKAPDRIEIQRSQEQQLPAVQATLTYRGEFENICTYGHVSDDARFLELDGCSRMAGAEPEALESTSAILEVSNAATATRTVFRVSLNVSTPCPGLPAITSKFMTTPKPIPGAYIVMLEPAQIERPYFDQIAQSMATSAGGTVRHLFTESFLGFSMRGASASGAQALANDVRVKLVHELTAGTAFGIKGSGTGNGAAPPDLDRLDQRASLVAYNKDHFYRFPESVGGEERRVYVLDNGIDADHAEFERSTGVSRVIQNTSFNVIGRPGFTLCSESGVPDSHGTSVASLVAGRNLGAARDVELWDVPVMGGLVGGCENASADDVAKGLDTIMAVGSDKPSVIVMSLGFNAPQPGLDVAVRKALTRHVVVAAAGNNLQPVENVVPANVAGVITVGAADLYDRFWSVNDDGASPATNFGPEIDVVATGETVAATAGQGSNKYFEGTSAAAPLVAGAAVLALDSSQALEPKHVRAQLVRASTEGAVQPTYVPLSGTPNRLLFVEGRPRLTTDVVREPGRQSGRAPSICAYDNPQFGNPLLLVGLDGRSGTSPSRVLYALSGTGDPVDPIERFDNEECTAALLTDDRTTRSSIGFVGCLTGSGQSVIRKIDSNNNEVLTAGWPYALPSAEVTLGLGTHELAAYRIAALTFDPATTQGRLRVFHPDGILEGTVILDTLPGYGAAIGTGLVVTPQ